MKRIFDMIRKGSKYIVRENLGRAFDKHVQDDKEDYYLLVPNIHVMDRKSLNRIFERYYIHEIFDIANCYLGSFNEPFMYWHLSKHPRSEIYVAIFYGYAHPYRDNEANVTGKLRIPDKYNENYKAYIALLEQWVKTGIKPENEKGMSEFRIIDENEFDYTKPYAKYYCRTNDKLRLVLRSAEIVPLKELADVIHVSLANHGFDATRVKTLDPNRAPSYPYDPELQAKEGFISTERLHKGDLVEQGYRKFFLLDKETDFDLYAPPGRSVIRAKKVCPEYLYLFLNSQIAKQMLHVFKVPLGDFSSTDLVGSLEDFPIIIPKEGEEFYKSEFLKLSAPSIRTYEIPNKISAPNSAEQVLAKEIMEKIKLNNDTLLKKQIDEDVAELNTCFSNGAYKSTLILAGSIMEALLIDWLSEIRGVNYFEVTLRKRVWDKSRKCYEQDENGNYIYRDNTRADLADYIDEIKDIKRPQWMEEAQEAHFIRNKRNLVHAKLCLKQNADINETTCRDVVDYLKNIISSRWQ